MTCHSSLYFLVEMVCFKACFFPIRPSVQQTFKQHLLSARPLPGVCTRPGPHGLPLPEVALSACALMDRWLGPCVWRGLASGLRACVGNLRWCVQAAQAKGPRPAHPHYKWALPPLATQAKSPSPGTHQNLILQRGNHINHEKHRERGERVTEAEWEACGWQLTGSLAPVGPFPSGEGALRAWRPSGTLHPSGWGTGAHSPGSRKPSSCSSGCSSAEH